MFNRLSVHCQLGRAVAMGACAGLIAAAALCAGAWWGFPAGLHGPVGEGGWTDRTRAPFTTRGFFPPEIDEATYKPFSWMGTSTSLRFPRLDRHRPHQLTLDVVGAPRPDDAPAVTVLVAIDGMVQQEIATPLSLEPQQLAIDIGPRNRPGAVVGLRVSQAFEAGPSDPRTIGMRVSQVGITGDGGHFRPSVQVIWQTALASAACAFGLFLCAAGGATRWERTVREIVLPGATLFAFVGLLLHDGAFLGTYVDHLLTIGLAVAAAGSIASAFGDRRPAVAAVSEWRLAAGIVLAATAVKVAMFWHPAAMVGDGIFHVHRAQLVRAGEYFFTSVTPRPFFEFPYPVGLYVAAQPLWKLFDASNLDLLRLLRLLVLAVDAVGAFVLFAAARRLEHGRAMALACVALWPFARAPLEATANANLTNAFGQAVFGIALAATAWAAASGPPRAESRGRAVRSAAAIAVCALLCVALLSHFGTTLIAVPMIALVSAALIVAGRDGARQAGWWLLAGAILAGVLAWGVYYSHFMHVYHTTSARVATIEEDSTSKMVAPVAIKFQRWVSGGGDNYGLPSVAVLATAAIGIGILLKQRRRDALSLMLIAWIVCWASLSALGILTPYSARANLAAAPAFVGLCAVTLATLSRVGRAGQWLSVAFAGVLAWDGVRIALDCLGLMR